MASQQPYKMLAGDTAVIRLTFRKTSDGELMDLDSEVSEIELEVKLQDGGADPALIGLTLTGGEIVKLAQAGETLGQADATIASSLTAPPFAPAVYRYDVVATLTPSGARHHGVKPSDFEVVAVVNQA